jgi:hypothetical protein
VARPSPEREYGSNLAPSPRYRGARARAAPALRKWRNALRLLRPTYGLGPAPRRPESGGACGERGDGQQKIGGVRRIPRARRKLRGPLRGDEAGIAAFPSLELALKKGATFLVTGQASQMRVDAREEAAGSIRAAACAAPGGDLLLLYCSHPVPILWDSAVGTRGEDAAMSVNYNL